MIDDVLRNILSVKSTKSMFTFLLHIDLSKFPTQAIFTIAEVRAILAGSLKESRGKIRLLIRFFHRPRRLNFGGFF